MSTEEQLRSADDAHTRLLMGAQAKHALDRTTYEALRRVAERHRTLGVPQVAAALGQLRREAA